MEKQVEGVYGKKYLRDLGDGEDKGVSEDLSIYKKEDIRERNETYEVIKYAKGYLGIGDDGGGNMYILNCETGDILKTDMGDMNPQNSMYITNLEKDWEHDLSKELEEEEEVTKDDGEFFRVDITKGYVGGAKGLIRVKKEFPDLTTKELLDGIRKPPYTLVKGISKDDATLRVMRLGGEGVGFEIIRE